MAEPIELPIGNGFYVSESLPISTQVCQNFYPNYPETESISQAQLLPTPGLVELADAGNGNINRGGHVMDGVPYFVCGSSLYSLTRVFDAFGNAVYTLNDLGAIAGTDRVSMDDNGEQLCIVVPGTSTAYIYTVSGGLVQITDPNFIPSPIASVVYQVVFVDGYFVFAADNSVFFHSELNDGTSYVATDFGTYDDARKDITAIHVHKEQLYVFGDTTGKAYRNVGGSGFVFQEITGFSFSAGCAARFSIVETGGTFAMIGRNVNGSPKIFQFTGNDFSPISTTSIEYLLQTYNDQEIQDSFSFSYSFRGASFSGWSLINNTFVFDSKASQLSGKKIWHERRSVDVQLKNRWRVNSLLSAYGTLICGDSEGGLIGELNYDTRMDYDKTIIRQFSLPVIENNSKKVYHRMMEIMVDGGFGGDSEPAVSMDYSNDGYIYKSERFRYAGKTGDYSKKLRWYNLGQTSRLRVYRFTMSAPVKWVVLKVTAIIDA